MSLNQGMQRYREAINARKQQKTQVNQKASGGKKQPAEASPAKTSANAKAEPKPNGQSARKGQSDRASTSVAIEVSVDFERQEVGSAEGDRRTIAGAADREAIAGAIDRSAIAGAIDVAVSILDKKLAGEEESDEIEKEIVRETAKVSSLVRDDFSPTNSDRETLIREYAPLIKYIAQKIAARLPANIELDDLISSGVIGLMDAIDKFDSTRDNKFKTYAEFRIRGAILDELRSQDWVPRSVREKSKLLEKAYLRIEQERGRSATDEEVCEELGISQGEFYELLSQVRSVSLLSWDDMSSFSKADKRLLHGFSEGNSRSPTPYSEVTVAYLKRVIAEAIGDLPEKQRLVLSLYYFEDLNLKEIGRVLDVTESRVSQLHTQAVLKLKAKLRTNWDEFATLLG